MRRILLLVALAAVALGAAWMLLRVKSGDNTRFLAVQLGRG